MRQRSVDAIDRTLSWIPWVFLLYLAFIVYGSLLPFQLRAPPTDGAWEAFVRLPYLQLGVTSRADWVANLLLYIPLGFLAVGWAQGRGPANPIHGLAALIVVGAIAVGVEYAQIFFSPRTVSMNDLVAEWLGAAVGVGLWYATRERLGRLLVEARGAGTRALRAAILLYLVAYLVLAVFPFDFLVSAAELRWRLSTDTWGVLFAQAAGGSAVRRTLQLLVDVAAMVPLGVLVSLHGSSTSAHALRRAAIAGAAFGLLIEGVQFFTASGISQGASVVARSAGAMLGASLSARVPGWFRHPPPAWLASAVLLALPVYGVALGALNGWFDKRWISFAQAAGRLKPEGFLPFYYHYYTTELAAMQSLVANALMYAPVGIGYWLWSAARRARSNAAVAASLAAALSVIVELGKFFAPAKHADPTNILIAPMAAVVAFLLVRRFQRAMAMPRSALRPDDVGSEAVTVDQSRNGTTQDGGAAADRLPSIWPTHPIDRARFAAGVVVLAAAAALLVRFPVWQLWLGAALAGYAWALWRNPSLWLIVIPAVLPSLDLAPASGWYFVDELDLFLLVTVGVALLRPAAGKTVVSLPRRAALLLAVFAAAYAIATLRGLLPLGPLGFNALANPYSSYESLRIAKGAIWAFLLLPLLQRAFAAPARAGGYLTTGMTLGLLLAGAVVVAERLAFTGLLDFSSDFRVTGAFSGMNTGGGAIEAYFVMALPFALLSLTQRGRWYGSALGLVAFTLGAYALLVTFARGGYAAGAIGLAVAAIGLFVARRGDRGGGRSMGRIVGVAVTSAVVALFVVVAVSAPYMAGRFSGTANDLQTRWNHWVDAIGMMDGGWATSLFGMGVGRFPETYFWLTEKDDRPGTFAFVEQGGNRYLRLGAGDPLYLRQVVAVEPHTRYRVSADVRSAQPGAALRVFVCEQALLYSGRCKSQSFTVGKGGDTWQSVEAVIDSGDVGSGAWLERRPVSLGLSYPSGESAVEIDNVRLIGADGVNLLRNGDFERGFDLWFFAVDWDPAWHIHNLWVAIYFEQGWLGVVAFTLLALSGLAAAARSTARGSRTSAALLGALCAFLAVGVVGSVFDFPRISLLFWLLLFAGLVRGNAYWVRTR